MMVAPSLGASGWWQGTATFARPVRSDTAILGGESVWRCQDTSCRGPVPDHPKSAERYCRQLARWGGPLVKFQAGSVVFDANALRHCNGGR